MEEFNTNETSRVDDTTVDYIEAINNLKQNTVDRKQYDQLKAENKKLLNSIVNGQSIDIPQPQQEKKSVEELRSIFLNEDANVSNLEWTKNALELRETLISEGQPDPFLPYGKQIMPTNEDIECANRVASVLQECVDYAEGDASVFTNELMRRTVDVKVR